MTTPHTHTHLTCSDYCVKLLSNLFSSLQIGILTVVQCQRAHSCGSITNTNSSFAYLLLPGAPPTQWTLAPLQFCQYSPQWPVWHTGSWWLLMCRTVCSGMLVMWLTCDLAVPVWYSCLCPPFKTTAVAGHWWTIGKSVWILTCGGQVNKILISLSFWCRKLIFFFFLIILHCFLLQFSLCILLSSFFY